MYDIGCTIFFTRLQDDKFGIMLINVMALMNW